MKLRDPIVYTKGEELLIAAIRPEDFTIRMSSIARRTGMPISTLHGAWASIKKHLKIKVTIRLPVLGEKEYTLEDERNNPTQRVWKILYNRNDLCTQWPDDEKMHRNNDLWILHSKWWVYAMQELPTGVMKHA